MHFYEQLDSSVGAMCIEGICESNIASIFATYKSNIATKYTNITILKREKR